MSLVRSPEQPPPNANNPRTKRKSKLGCKTCKVRRVKCNEARPVCGACTVYYSGRLAACEYIDPHMCPKPRNPRRLNDAVPREDVSRPGNERQLANKSDDVLLDARVHVLRRGSRIPESVGLKTLDPFKTQIQNHLPGAERLLHHYLTSIVTMCVPSGYTPDTNPLALSWWNFVRTDDFLHHLMLQVSAMDLEWARGTENEYHSISYSVDSVRLLRERLKDSQANISDQTLGAVAMMAAISFGHGNMKAAQMHVLGLKEMVKLRGGLDDIRASNSYAAHMVFSCTLLITNRSQFAPTSDQIPPFLTFKQSITDHQMTDFPAYLSNELTVNYMLATRQFCANFDNLVTSTSQPHLIPDDLGIHTSVSWLHQRLLHDPSTSQPLSTCCRYAASMFLFLPFTRQYPDPTLTLNSFLHALKSELEVVLAESWDAGVELLLVWLLAIGGIVAEKLPAERRWFVGWLAEVGGEMEVEEVKECLLKVAWLIVMDDAPLKSLWDEVGMIRAPSMLGVTRDQKAQYEVMR